MKTVYQLLICVITLSSCNNFTGDSGVYKDSRDGTSYKWLKIGAQIWMSENLAYLPDVSPSDAKSDSTPSYYVYGYQGQDVSVAKADSNYAIYGVLYNWPAAGSSCPSGWHLPSDGEWVTMTEYLNKNGFGLEDDEESIGKSLASATGWMDYTAVGTIGNDQSDNNSSGFSARPGGKKSTKDFMVLGKYAFYWSSSESSETHAIVKSLVYTGNRLMSQEEGHWKWLGYSVRCVKDE